MRVAIIFRIVVFPSLFGPQKGSISSSPGL
jgi:hypothetical protein